MRQPTPGYHRRIKKARNKLPELNVIRMQGTENLIKASGQLQDPFEEEKFVQKYIQPPYKLNLLLDFFEENTWHNACCIIKKNLVCGEYEIVPEGEEQKEDSEYKKLEEWTLNVNDDGEDLGDVIDKFWLDQETVGNSYFELVRGRGGNFAELYHIPGHTVRKAKDRDGYYQRRGTSVQESLAYFKKWQSKKDSAKTEIIHLKNYFPASSYYGMPDYLPAIGAMVLDKNAILFNNAFFDNSGMMGAILFIKGLKLSPDARTELKNMLIKNFTGVENAHRLALIDNLGPDAEFKLEKVMETIREMSFVQLRTFNRDEIIASHHVPPKLLHIPTRGQLGQVQEGWGQMKMFKIFEIDPSQLKFEKLLNKIIKLELGISKWKIKLKEMDVSSPEELNNEIWGDLDHQILTNDEARGIRGREPLQNQPVIPDKLVEDLEKMEAQLTKSLEGDYDYEV